MRVDALIECGADAAVALVERARSLSYAELREQVARIAAGLAGKGLSPGDRVAVYMGKTIEAVIALLAASRAGAVAVPVNPLLKSAQVAHILADSGAALLVSTRQRLAMLHAGEAVPANCRALTIEDDWRDLLGTPAAAPVAVDGNALAMLLYTSGSTGRPKGVMVSHANVVTGARSVVSYLGTSATDSILAVLPLSFDYGFNQLTTGLLAGARTVLLDYLTPRDVVSAVARHGITTLAGVPPLWMQLMAAAWPEGAGDTLRTLTNSGGRMPVALTRQIRARFPHAKLFLMYGLTEAFRSSYLDPALVDARPESIGTAIPGAELFVLRPDGTETAAGEPGELVHVGPLVAQGYWRDAERTAERFRPAPPMAQTGSVGVWSGDTVIRDADGLLSFVGRRDDMIKTSGNRVSPTEIEEAAFATGAVTEAAAFGMPDALLGESIALVVVPATGLDADRATAALTDALRQSLPSYMQPQRLVWRDTLPRNANGKIDRMRLREELQ